MKAIQIKHVPDKTHRALKVKAALAGKTLSDFLLAEIEEIASRPTVEELYARIRARGRDIVPTETAAAAVRAEREGHR